MTTATIKTILNIKSTAYKNNEFIPSKYTCEGSDINPDLEIKDLPSNTKRLALIVDDPDAPNGTYDHWVSGIFRPKIKLRKIALPELKKKIVSRKTGIPALVLQAERIITILKSMLLIPNLVICRQVPLKNRSKKPSKNTSLHREN